MWRCRRAGETDPQRRAGRLAGKAPIGCRRGLDSGCNPTDENATEQERNAHSLSSSAAASHARLLYAAENGQYWAIQPPGQSEQVIWHLNRKAPILMSQNTPSLELRTWVRIVNQSIAKAGMLGTECPMTNQPDVQAKEPDDTEQNRLFLHLCR